MGTDKQNKRASLVKIVHDMSVDLLRSNHKIASLRQIMGDSFVIPLIMKETSWRSVSAMLERFVVIYPHIISIDIDPNQLPSSDDFKLIVTLNEELQWLRLVKIQDDSMNIYQTQQWFNSIQSKFGIEFEFLSGNSVFENGLANVLSETTLTPEMTFALKDFEIPIEQNIFIDPENISPSLQILDDNLRKRTKFNFYNMHWIRSITPTSCQAERLCKSAISLLRSRMISEVLEAKLMLTENSSYWTNEYCEDFRTLRDPKGYFLVQSLLNASDDKEELLNSQQNCDAPNKSDKEPFNESFLDDDE
jgi:hypothetical protein